MYHNDPSIRQMMCQLIVLKLMCIIVALWVSMLVILQIKTHLKSPEQKWPLHTHTLSQDYKSTHSAAPCHTLSSVLHHRFRQKEGPVLKKYTVYMCVCVCVWLGLILAGNTIPRENFEECTTCLVTQSLSGE